jgi:putative ABC transport system permease protein
MITDFRFALRTFRRTPLLVGAAILATALGVGANTAIFSVIQAVLLRPLPYRDPSRIVMLWEKNPVFGGMLAERLPVAARNLSEWRHEATSFTAIEAVNFTTFDLTGGDRPEEVPAALVSPGFFDLFGRHPSIGRGFAPDEDTAGKDQVAVLSFDLWRRRFGEDPDIAGKQITANGKTYSIVGVLPADFHLPSAFQGMEPSRGELWVPLTRSALTAIDFQRRLYVYGRLRTGVTIGAARAEMTAIAKRLEARFDADHGFGASVWPIATEDLSPETVRTVWALQVAVGFVLLIACANVANLLLARAAGRGREMAIRAAVGASRGRLVRQALAESLLLGGLGGGLGLLLADFAMRAIAALAPRDNYHFHEIGLDWTVLAFAAGVAMASGLLFGIAPALTAAAGNLRDALVSDSRSGASRGSKRFRGALVVAEVAAAVVLLAGAGLMIRSLAASFRVSPGFDAAHVLTAHVRLPENRYSKPEQAEAFCNELLDHLARIPGVEAASLSNGLPMMDSLSVRSFRIPGDPRNEARETDAKSVTEDYFRAAGMPILEGRGFTREDAAQESKVMLVNQTFARMAFAGHPLGKAVAFGDRTQPAIVGVVPDTHELGLETPARPEVYLPTRRLTAMAVMLRTKGDPMSLGNALTAAVWAIDKDQPIVDIRSLSDHLSLSFEQRRFDTLLFGGLAGLALLLAAVGVYGVLSYSVLLRTRELGVRMALGAQEKDVLRLVVTDGLKLAGAGVAIGGAAALALTRFMSGIVFAVSPSDPVTFAGAVLVLLGVALAACYIPARRAAMIDPLRSLRAE